MSNKITKYNAICNLGSNIDDIFESAINGNSDFFNTISLSGKSYRIGKVLDGLPQINVDDYNTRTNRLALKAMSALDVNDYVKKYGAENIAVVAATTNSGVEEYENTLNPKYSEIGNLGEFVKNHFKLNNYCTTVSTACSSGIKAFKIANEILDSDIAKCVFVVCSDAIAKVPLYGFGGLEIMSESPSIPFSKNRSGINIGEGAAVFVIEKECSGIEIAGIGETTDSYHSTTPDPSGKEAENAIREALNNADLKPDDVDYINLHGTGTPANDLSEGNAIYNIFGSKTPTSSTKPLTGHCLGAAAGIETALCCKLLESECKKVFPHIYDGNYDTNIPKINLAPLDNTVNKIDTCLITSFGFGGTNCAMIIKKG